ncbi:YceI family protein [Actibacterium sp. 188UL27-1]|uniref:YceI family protein n=1 Tax=Actibacterium sp. 188UL27-1 TaxID=2786961 RepID=UPI001958B41F|nr:YceI family protein [Actibacterium sp. 188UL27-1]MBM7068571.1 YceI family protein [Actibacterium sp. 188UL27-1]
MFKTFTATMIAITLGAAAQAETWTLDGGNSHLAFGSIKKDELGEVHTFNGLSGTVSEEGNVAVEIDLTSVETNIDIRNERMIEHVFKDAATATLSAEIEMDALNALPVGGMTTIEVFGSLSLVGTELDVDTEMFVVRLSESQVMVTTNDIVFLNAIDAGINEGVTKLMELAELPSITRTSPVTMRLIFTTDDQKAEAAPITQKDRT